MDGHDNDTNSTNNSGSMNGGIFSTPDLTVNAENITQPSRENEQKRVASIFANTDTGRQAQRLNDAMEAQTAPVTEDLVIRNEPKGRKKWPWVVGIMLLLSAGIGCSIFFLLGKGGGIQSTATPEVAFSQYFRAIKYGPTDIDSSDEEVWFIFRANQELALDDLRSYMNDILTKYNTFKEYTVEGFSSSDLEFYNSLFDIIMKSTFLSVIDNDVLLKYLDDGKAGALDYVNQNTVISHEGDEYDTINTAYDALADYLNDEVRLIELYKGWGCISDNVLDYPCIQEHGNSNLIYQTLSDQQAMHKTFLRDYNSELRPSFIYATNTLSDKLEGEE